MGNNAHALWTERLPRTGGDTPTSTPTATPPEPAPSGLSAIAVIAGSPDTATIILQDNDTPSTQVEQSFDTASYTAVEGGSAATVTVELDANPERVVTIPNSVTRNGGRARATTAASLPA